MGSPQHSMCEGVLMRQKTDISCVQPAQHHCQGTLHGRNNCTVVQITCVTMSVSSWELAACGGVCHT